MFTSVTFVVFGIVILRYIMRRQDDVLKPTKQLNQTYDYIVGADILSYFNKYIVGQIGHKCMKPLCRKVADRNGHLNFKSLLDEADVKSQIHQLRGVKDGGREMKNVLTERQWFSLYKTTGNKNGVCRIEAREDVENMVDISLVHKLLTNVFSGCIPKNILNDLSNLQNVKEQIDDKCYLEERLFEKFFNRSRDSLLRIAKYTGEDISQHVVNAEHAQIQNLVDENLENYLKLRMLLKDPAERIMRSTMDVSMARAGFKDREEMFENKFVQSELSRKAFVWSNNRGCGRNQRSFLAQFFDIHGHYKSVKESIVQCLSCFDFDLMYKMMRDISVLRLELTPYTKEGVMSFVKNLRDIYGQVMRGCPDNKIGMSDFRRYWSVCEEALKVLLHFTGCSYDEDIHGILKMNLKISGSSKSYMGNPLIFRVRLEFPPDGLTKYEFARIRVAEAIRKHDEDGMSSYLQLFDQENHDLIFIHHEHHSAVETCECFFDAEANLTQIDPEELQRKDQRDYRNPVVCLVDSNVHRMNGRCEYIGLIRKTTLEEIAHKDFTKADFPYLFDAKYCSEWEKRPIYIAMQNVLTVKISSVVEGIRGEHESNHLIDILQKHQEGIREESKGAFKLTKEFKEWLCKQIPTAIECFSVSKKLKIYFRDNHGDRLRSEILEKKYAVEEDLKFVRMNESLKFIPLFRPGTCIYINRSASDTGGTITLYGKLRSNSKEVAITHGHIIQSGQKAYTTVEGLEEELGKAIYPTYQADQMYPGELSVVEISNEKVKLLLQDAKEKHKAVFIYRGNSSDLYRKKVVKFGAATERTVGFVVETLTTGTFGQCCEGIVIEEQKQGRFAEERDSGALAYIPRRDHIIGVSLIFSKYPLHDSENDVHKVLTANFNDCKNTFERKRGDLINIESDHGLSLMGNLDSVRE